MQIPRKAQTSIEYIMLAGAVIALVIIVVVVTRGNVLGPAGGEVENKSKDIGGILASIPGKIPWISAVAVTHPALNIVALSWETDIPATSTVEYWNATSRFVTGGSVQVTSHSVTLPPLPALYVYDYRVTSCSSESGCNASVAGTFTA
ncbi:MAG: class III signal peptide-containing protein [Candidatus Micrarchaeota archaeon]